MKKVIRLTESQLTNIIKKVIKEQIHPNTQQDYDDMANYLYKSMVGLSSSEDAENIKYTIENRIKNKKDWEGVKKSFGVRDGENLEQWLQGEMRINLNQILSRIDANETQFRKEDAQYNPGKKIRLITNKQLLMARQQQSGHLFRDIHETDLDINDATIIKRDKGSIVVKAKSVDYYRVSEYKRGTTPPKQEYLYNVCIKIPFNEIIGWSGDDILQVNWLSDFVTLRIVPC